MGEWSKKIYNKPAYAAAAVAGTAAVVSSPWWFSALFGAEESSISKTVSNNKVATVVGSLLVLPALCFGGYKLYQKYFAPKAEENDSGCDSNDVECGSRSAATGNKKKKSSKKEEKGSNKMLLIFGVLAAVVAFLFLGKAEKKSASPLEGDELV